MFATTSGSARAGAVHKGPLGLARSASNTLGRVPLDIVLLMARCAVAIVFWKSGQLKLANWDTTVFLFAHEYPVPVLPPEVAAYLATGFELACPVLLVLGLFTRLATLPLIGMTLIIQVFVYPLSYADHLLWATALLLVLTRGPGLLSLDFLISKTLFRH